MRFTDRYLFQPQVTLIPVNTPNLAQTESDLDALQVTIEQAQNLALRGAALERLRTNNDFRVLFEQGYLQDEAVRLVHAKGLPNLQDAVSQAGIDHDIRAISSFGSYCDRILSRGAMAVQSLDEHRQELARAELERSEAESADAAGGDPDRSGYSNVHSL